MIQPVFCHAIHPFKLLWKWWIYRFSRSAMIIGCKQIISFTPQRVKTKIGSRISLVLFFFLFIIQLRYSNFSDFTLYAIITNKKIGKAFYSDYFYLLYFDTDLLEPS